MSSIHTSRTCFQERDRRHSLESDQSTESISSLDPPWKKGGFRSQEEANTAFWDNLSQVPLCPDALREFDRRNWLSVGLPSKSTARSAKHTTRSATTSAAQLDCRRSAALGSCVVELKRFAKRGGPDLHDLRKYFEPSFSTMGRQMTARNKGFEWHLLDHDIHPKRHHPDGQHAPNSDNWDEIQQRTRQRRSSTSKSQLSDGVFEEYVMQTENALDKADIMEKAFPIVKGKNTIPYGIRKQFQNLTPLTDGTLVNPTPDLYDGAHPGQLDSEIRKKLSSYIVPCANGMAPILPNNFTESKGPDGSMAVAALQACYDGALGARGMQKLQSHGQPQPIYDNNAYTITSDYNGNHLQMYSTHMTAPVNPGDRPGYQMNKIGGWDMTGQPDTFREGVTAFRTGRDWAKEKRDQFIDAANSYKQPFTVMESDPSGDELTTDDGLMGLRSGQCVQRG